jgi:hypothetical protein
VQFYLIGAKLLYLCILLKGELEIASLMAVTNRTKMSISPAISASFLVDDITVTPNSSSVSYFPINI